MPYRIAENTINASTIDILNVIRLNASAEYQSLVPLVEKTTDIPRVGAVLYGHPALANQFLNALVNRIALVRMQGATFNNPYRDLKKGYLNFGETIEEVFVQIAKAREFSAEKAEAREFKRYLPDVRAAFHVINWRVMYPVTIEDEQLRMAFTSAEGVRDMIAKIVDSVYTGAEYDEYLLFKYLIIKGLNKGQIAVSALSDDSLTNAAVAFRGMSNKLEFMGSKYNLSGVTTNTKREDQYIFMDSDFNAAFDVNVLASAFNMDKATFIGHLKLIDNFAEFDNERFDVIRANSDGLEEVTTEELATMQNVKAIIFDSEWFQIYDNNNRMTEKYVASGLYWNYFYHVWKTVSSSPFSNAVAFVVDNAANPATITATVDGVNESVDPDVKVVTLHTDIGPGQFVQTESLTQAGIAVQKYGAFIFPTEAGAEVTIEMLYGNDNYTGTINLAEVSVGDTVTLTKA